MTIRTDGLKQVDNCRWVYQRLVESRDNHYLRMWKLFPEDIRNHVQHGTPLPTDEKDKSAESKYCARCHRRKPVGEFDQRNYQNGRKGLRPYCRACE